MSKTFEEATERGFGAAIDEKEGQQTAGVRVSPEEVEEVMQASDYRTLTLFGKCTVVAMRMPCGYVLVESSACVNPGDYDEEVGADICRQRIEDRVWALLGYEHMRVVPHEEAE